VRRGAILPLAALSLLTARRAGADGGGPAPVPAPVAVAVAAPAPSPSLEDYARTGDGTWYRVRFDPASHVWIGGGVTLLRGALGPVAAPEVDAGIAYRSVSVSGAGAERVTWQIDHSVLTGFVVPRAGAGGGMPPLDASVYAISMLRHDASPRIVLPTSPPVGIPFPLDVGFASEVGRVTISDRPASARGDGLPAVRVGVVRADMIFDPWRSGRPGRSLELGLGARYDIDAYAAAWGAPEPGTVASLLKVVHRVAPMTAGSLGLRFQTDDGLLSLRCRGEVVPHLTSEGGWKTMASGSAHVERTIVAVSDAPVAAVVEGGYRFVPATRDLDAVSDYRVSLGLAWSLPLTK
jgi:hypothetical protein